LKPGPAIILSLEKKPDIDLSNSILIFCYVLLFYEPSENSLLAG